MSISMETTQNIEKCKISTTERARTIFFNEPELTCAYMHLIHFTCIFYMVYEIFKIFLFFDEFGRVFDF